jgi:PLP dependent protein
VPHARIAPLPAETTTIAANLDRIRERIERAASRASRRPEGITIVAVSKTFPPEAIRAAYDLGLRHFGENRVQEFEDKQPKLADIGAAWHFIGHLQGNKARRAVNLFDRIDSADSLALGQKLDSAAAAENKRLPILIEVHAGGEQTKSGVAEEEVSALTESLLPFSHLELRGLLAIPPYFDDPERTRPYFRRLRELRDDLSRQIGHPLPVLSMGMSHDLEVAIEEGATEIRIGTALFGERPRAEI